MVNYFKQDDKFIESYSIEPAKDGNVLKVTYEGGSVEYLEESEKRTVERDVVDQMREQTWKRREIETAIHFRIMSYIYVSLTAIEGIGTVISGDAPYNFLVSFGVQGALWYIASVVWARLCKIKGYATLPKLFKIDDTLEKYRLYVLNQREIASYFENNDSNFLPVKFDGTINGLEEISAKDMKEVIKLIRD